MHRPSLRVPWQDKESGSFHLAGRWQAGSCCTLARCTWSAGAARTKNDWIRSTHLSFDASQLSCAFRALFGIYMQQRVRPAAGLSLLSDRPRAPRTLNNRRHISGVRPLKRLNFDCMGDEEAVATPKPVVRPLLHFDDPFFELKTRPTSFEGVVTPGEVVSLNHIRCARAVRNPRTCMLAQVHSCGDPVTRTPRADMCRYHSMTLYRDMTGQRNIACVRESHKNAVSKDLVEWWVLYVLGGGFM